MTGNVVRRRLCLNARCHPFFLAFPLRLENETVLLFPARARFCPASRSHSAAVRLAFCTHRLVWRLQHYCYINLLNALRLSVKICSWRLVFAPLHRVLHASSHFSVFASLPFSLLLVSSLLLSLSLVSPKPAGRPCAAFGIDSSTRNPAHLSLSLLSFSLSHALSLFFRHPFPLSLDPMHPPTLSFLCLACFLSLSLSCIEEERDRCKVR